MNVLVIFVEFLECEVERRRLILTSSDVLHVREYNRGRGSEIETFYTVEMHG
jgi:hypothetical protein